MKINSKVFRVSEGEKVDLKKRPTKIKPFCKSKEEYRTALREHVEELRPLQELLFASNSFSLLLIFQAMDAAGKDSAIKHVMSGVDPQGCQVFSFKHPSAEDLDHDFLWRTTLCLPERGRIGIFNRSYYEEVLIVRVHPEILRAQRIPDGPAGKELWDGRHRSIRDLEEHLHRNGTRVIKFFLHLSKEEQRLRFLKRLETPEKNWKLDMADLKERGFWKEYMQAYEECLSATSTVDSPWYVIPADNKGDTRLLISRIILDTLKGLDMSYPKAGPERQKQLKIIRKMLEK